MNLAHGRDDALPWQEKEMRIAATSVFLSVWLVAGCASSERKIVAIGNEIKSASHKRPRDFSSYTPERTRVDAGSISARTLHGATDERLLKLYNAARSMTFYFPESSEYYGLQEKIFNEMRRRNNLADTVLAREYWTRLTARDLTAASDLVRLFPAGGLDPLPEIDENNSLPLRTAWLGYGISADGRKIWKTVVPVVEGVKIMMVMSPGCGFVEAAMSDLLADSRLAMLLRKYGLFVSADFYPADMASWGKKYNIDIENIYISYKDSSFRGIELNSGTPHFYFMNNGKILADSDGWCVSGHSDVCIAEFKRGLVAISISPDHATDK